ncbi:MAG: asparagine synthase (glutamine-hydrolyzing) [Agriterribacter sp.]
MCGINGIVKKVEALEKVKTEISHMNNCIIHRGPDDDGSFSDIAGGKTIGMGMRRLSIIDLSTGKQPIFSRDRKKVIVFNGEIYNYQTLKKELIKNFNPHFSTTSDTEVVLHLFEQYGVEAFNKLDGMFAFSIYDMLKQKIYIVRDKFGEKPLYYSNNTEQLIWSSELKAIQHISGYKHPISITGLNLFFRLTYIPAPYTIYDDVYKLEPGNYLEYDLKANELLMARYDLCEHYPPGVNVTYDDTVKQIEAMVFESVRSRSVSDVPVGTFLSGGVDSSIVSLCLSKSSSKPIDTFSIGFKEKAFDESPKARTVAKLINSNHHEFIIDQDDLFDQVNNVVLNFDEPFADSSALPSYLVASKAKSTVKVVLTGDGGDEVFAGYNKYYMAEFNRKYTSVVPEFVNKGLLKIADGLFATRNDNRGLKFKIRKFINAVEYDKTYYWNIISMGFPGKTIEPLLLNGWLCNDVFSYYKEKSGFDGPDNITEMRNIDRMVSLEGDMLTKVDRASMLASLECRAPFLNPVIWNYASSLPEKFLLNKRNKKKILKDAFSKYFPDEFLNLKKHGFGVPVGNWLRDSLRSELLKYTDRDFVQAQGIFNHDYIKKLVDGHISQKVDNTFKVWAYFCFQMWYSHKYNIE